MSIVSAKSLNDTLGTDNFSPFDVILGKQIETLIDALNSKTEQEIKSSREIKKIEAAYPKSEKTKYYYIGGNSEDTFSAKMPCEGSFYVDGGGSLKTVNIYINGVLKQSYVRNAFVFFSKNDKVTIVVNNEYEQESLGKSYFYIYAIVS